MRFLAGCSVIALAAAFFGLILMFVTALVVDRVVDEAATEQVHSLIREAHAEGQVSVERIDFKWLRMRIVAEGIELRDKVNGRPLMRIQESGCGWPTLRGQLVTAAECSLNGVQLVGAVPPGMPPGVFDMGVDWNLDTRGEARLQLACEWHDVLRGEWTLRMSGVTDALLAASGDVARAGSAPAARPAEPGLLAPDLALRELAVAVRDLGGRQRVFHAVSGAAGANTATLGQVIAQSAEGALQMLGVPSNGNRAAVETWLARGGVLRVGTHNVAPVRVFDNRTGVPQLRGSAYAGDLLQFVSELNIGASVGP